MAVLACDGVPIQAPADDPHADMGDDGDRARMVFMPVVMVHIKPASSRTKTVAELTILNITSRG